ncbi:hypothetical protein AAG570_001150 [Ranatra chinensis]|uniref:Uncharacterized protein n=1 Tax=Ranatra chinensis TaxID=642074 RepID=A0ABD0YBS1_9HEMI
MASKRRNMFYQDKNQEPAIGHPFVINEGLWFPQYRTWSVENSEFSCHTVWDNTFFDDGVKLQQMSFHTRNGVAESSAFSITFRCLVDARAVLDPLILVHPAISFYTLFVDARVSNPPTVNASIQHAFLFSFDHAAGIASCRLPEVVDMVSGRDQNVVKLNMSTFGLIDTDSLSFAPRMEVVKMVLKVLRYGKMVRMESYNADVIGKSRHIPFDGRPPPGVGPPRGIIRAGISDIGGVETRMYMMALNPDYRIRYLCTDNSKADKNLNSIFIETRLDRPPLAMINEAVEVIRRNGLNVRLDRIRQKNCTRPTTDKGYMSYDAGDDSSDKKTKDQ